MTDPKTVTVQEPACPKCAEREEMARRAWEYYRATTCPCIAAERYVADCPKHGINGGRNV